MSINPFESDRFDSNYSISNSDLSGNHCELRLCDLKRSWHIVDRFDPSWEMELKSFQLIRTDMKIQADKHATALLMVAQHHKLPVSYVELIKASLLDFLSPLDIRNLDRASLMPTKETPYTISVILHKGFYYALYLKCVAQIPSKDDLTEYANQIAALNLTNFNFIESDTEELMPHRLK